MFEVIAFGTESRFDDVCYSGTNWVQALVCFYFLEQNEIHSVLFEDNSPIREHLPGMGSLY